MNREQNSSNPSELISAGIVLNPLTQTFILIKLRSHKIERNIQKEFAEMKAGQRKSASGDGPSADSERAGSSPSTSPSWSGSGPRREPPSRRVLGAAASFAWIPRRCHVLTATTIGPALPGPDPTSPVTGRPVAAARPPRAAA